MEYFVLIPLFGGWAKLSYFRLGDEEMNVFTDHGDYGGSPIKDFILNSHGDAGCKMGAHGNGGGSKLNQLMAKVSNFRR